MSLEVRQTNFLSTWSNRKLQKDYTECTRLYYHCYTWNSSEFALFRLKMYSIGLTENLPIAREWFVISVRVSLEKIECYVF